MSRIFEVIDKDGKHFHKYEFHRKDIPGSLYTTYGESWDEVVKDNRLNPDDYTHEEAEFFMWDYSGWAKPVRRELK